MKKFSTLLEDIGKTGDPSIGFGVKGKLKAKGEMDDKTVVNPDAKMDQQDIKILSEIDSKITRGLQLFSDLEEFIKEWNKLNYKPISNIIASMKSFQEGIKKELQHY